MSRRVVSAAAVGAATSSPSSVMSAALGTRRSTLATAPGAPGARGGERAGHAARPRRVVEGADRLAPGGAEPGAQPGVVVEAPDGGGEGVLVARGHDQARALVLHEPAGGGSHGVGCDDGNSLVEGFVDDEAPRLAEVARGDRRYDHNVAAGVEVAEPDRIDGPCARDRAGGDGPGSERAAADQNQRGRRC